MANISSPSLFIDPSYKGTGVVWADPVHKSIVPGLFSEPQTKRSFANYYNAAKGIIRQLSDWFQAKNFTDPVDIYQELPVPVGMSSAGLYGLQFKIFDYLTASTLIYLRKIYGVTPAWIKQAHKKYDKSGNKGVDSISTRKKSAAFWVDRYRHDGWQIKDDHLFHKAGDDVATAFLFFVYTDQFRTDQWHELEVR